MLVVMGAVAAGFWRNRVIQQLSLSGKENLVWLFGASAGEVSEPIMLHREQDSGSS